MNTAFRIADQALGQKITAVPIIPKFDEMNPMHAVVWHGKKQVSYELMPRPLLTHSKDVVVRVTASTICGSDLHLFSGAVPDMKDGDILGHECMGIIDDIGTDVKNFKKGDRVVVAFDIACGECDYCKKEEYSCCDLTNPSKLMEELYGQRISAIFGYSHLTGGVPGCQAEYVRVPFADVNCLKIPDDLPDEKALYLSDIVPTAYHGTDIGKVTEGSTVAIWGLGPVGLLTARWCQIRKAKRIIGIDCVPERLELAKKMGIEIIDFKKNDTVKTLLAMVPGGVDTSIECVGFEWTKSWTHTLERKFGLETDTSDILTELITCTRKCGTVSIIGAYLGTSNQFPIGALMEKSLHVTGGQSFTQKYWKMCLEKIKSGEIDPTFVVSHKAKLSDTPELYKRFYNRENGVIKLFLRPDSYIPGRH